jgi:hypothetical protein
MKEVTKFILVPVLVVTAVLLAMSAVQAAQFEFSDNTIYWGQGWTTGAWLSTNSDSLGYGDDNYTDFVGHPNFTTGSGIIESGALKEIHINYTNWDAALNPGDLFIDIGADKIWDYVLKPTGNIYSTLLDARKGFNDAGYQVTTNWPGYYIRNDHPYALNLAGTAASLAGSYTFSGFSIQDGNVDFTGLSIDLLGQDFIIGYAVTCANDVVYEKISNPVPEPATMLLLGTGLIGLAGFGRKRLLKK